MRVLGIDEAGRGCVLGDLVIAGYCPHHDDETALRAAGAADSKALTPERRVEARQVLAGMGRVEIRRVDARAIDGGNLNRLEEDAIVDIIVAIRPDVVRLDALGHPNTLPALKKRLQARLPRRVRPEWTIEPKADVTFACVGAASIFAKTLRDELLDGVRASYGELGSGYPSDPKTKAWLRGWSSKGEPWPSFVRTRWQTISDLSQQALF